MLDPLELVRQAKNRHYAYKPLSQSQGVMGEDYTPSILQGRDITKSPANAAALAAQGVRGANTPQVHPDSPLNNVEPTANGQTLPGFAGGGDVLSKVGKVLSGLLEKFKTPVAEEATHESAALPTDRFSDLMRKYQQKQITLPEMNELIGSLSKSPSEQSILGQPELPKVDVGGGGLSNNQADDLLSGNFAEGGSADSSSLKWIADMSRKLGIPSYADDRARVATGIAKQFYGLDERGHPKFGGDAWLSSQHGTPPRILDEMTAIPGDIARLANTVFGGKIPANANVTPEERRAMEREIPVPKWSDDAADRVSAFDQAAEKETGVGQAHSLPEHIEDAAGMLATPFPASKVAGEAPALQRLFEYLTPVRPPTLDRYATDSAMLGGAGAGLDKLINRLSSKPVPKDTSTDPQFEQAAIDSTNQGYAGGGSTRRDLFKKLASLAAAATAGPMVKTLVKDTPDVVKSGASALEHTAPVTTAPRVVMKDENPESLIPRERTLAEDTGNYMPYLVKSTSSVEIPELKLLGFMNRHADRLDREGKLFSGKDEDLGESLPQIHEVTPEFGKFMASQGVAHDPATGVYHYDPSRANSIRSEIGKITEEYEDGGGPTWEKYGLGGDDDVDYHGGYVESGLDLLHDFTTNNPK